MGDSGDGQDADSTLSELFDHCLKLVKEVREASVPSTDPELQSVVRSAISGLESLTRKVSAAGLFSSNESAEELPTGSLRLLLLPALLGELTCRLAHEERMQVIGIAEVYYRDFLQRCRDYGIVDVDIPGPRSRGDDSGGASGGGGAGGGGGGGGGGSGGASGGAHHIQQAPRAPTMRDLATMSKQREERLRRYREQKELDKKLAELEEALRRPGADEETARTYQLTLLKQAAARAVSELQSLQLEKPILEHMQQLKNARGGAAAAADATPAPTVAPLRPVVITRTKLEAAVFGAGYSSLPTMSVEEFYEQRVRDGVFPGGGQQGATSLVNQPAPTTTDDDKEEERDRLEDTDDAVTLARARQWDDYRDTHKRGEGNRYNRS